MLTLREDGLAKVRAGLTSLEEVLRVTPKSAPKRPIKSWISISPRFCAAWSRPSASDVHLTAGFPPAIRVKGQDRADGGLPGRSTAQQTREVVYSILNDDQRKRFENNQQLDFAYAIPSVARFRVNCFFQRGAISAAFRLVPHEIPDLDSLGVPQVLRDFTRKPRGFVLVTGPTGSGKSTTLAAMVDVINHEREDHILTIEDPIEFLHDHKRSIVNQREIGADALDFALGLRAALRQDPDVILVGEMRDLETISTALTAAETGHLVFATLHTQSTAQTVDRIIDVFPPEQQGQVRTQLSIALQGIVTQQLLPTADGTGRVVATEVLVPTPAIRNLIREGEDPPDLRRDPDLGRGRDADDGRRPRAPGAGRHDHPRAGRAAGLGPGGAEAPARPAAAPTQRRSRRSRSPAIAGYAQGA